MTILGTNILNKKKKTFAEQVLINILSNLPIGMFIISPNYSIEYINEIMKEVYSNTNIGDKLYEKVIGKPNPLDLELITDIINHKIEKASLIVNDVHGNILHIRVNRIVNPNETESFILMIRDITDSKKAEAKIIKNELELELKYNESIIQLKEEKIHFKESEQKFRAIFDNSPEGILVADPITKKFIQANPRICRMTGYTEQELLQLSIEKLHRKRDIPFLVGKLIQANPDLSKIRNYTIKELLMLNTSRIFPRLVKEFEENGKFRFGVIKRVPILKKDKKIIHCNIYNTLISSNGQNYILGFFKNIN